MGVVVSQIVIVIWWDDALVGTMLNLLIVAAVALAGPLELRFDRGRRDGH